MVKTFRNWKIAEHFDETLDAKKIQATMSAFRDLLEKAGWKVVNSSDRRELIPLSMLNGPQEVEFK